MFEALLPFPNIDPIAIQLGPLAIRWYALAYIAGIVLGWWGVVRLLRQKRFTGSHTTYQRQPFFLFLQQTNPA